MSAANADVDAATRPAATIAFAKFIAGLSLRERSALLRPIALPAAALRAVVAAFIKI
jgi:hypothetical protein